MPDEQEVGVITFEAFRSDVAAELGLPAADLVADARLVEDLLLDSLELFRLSILLESYLPVEQLGLVDLAALAAVVTLGDAHGLLARVTGTP